MSRAGGRDAQLLGTLAEALEPERAPYYVSAPASAAPTGWYWTPAGSDRPTYLGRNVVWAERRLLELLRQPRQETAA